MRRRLGTLVEYLKTSKYTLASRPGGGPLVFKGGYHARVWPLKTDPKQGF